LISRRAEGVLTQEPKWIPVKEEVDVFYVDEIGHHLSRAQEAFLKNDLKRAASEIRRGMQLLRATSQHASVKGKEGLLSSAKELDELAKKVEEASVSDVKTLEDAFGRAHQATAVRNN
jgi:hypothetical protein